MCHNKYEFGIEIFYDQKRRMCYFQERLSGEQKESNEVNPYLAVRIILYFNESIKNIIIICRGFLN